MGQVPLSQIRRRRFSGLVPCFRLLPAPGSEYFGSVWVRLWSLFRGLPVWQRRAGLALIAAVGLAVAWWRYPVENKFSILSCTISFLGSPDANRNPHGWRFYQAGMTALVLLLFSLAAERHRRLRRQLGKSAWLSSAAILISLTLILLATWIPDSREVWLGVRAGDLHTRLAILAIPFMACGIVWDGVGLWWSGVRLRALWPFHLYAFVVLLGTAQLMQWERMCRQDPTLPGWPGPGLHSTPLWEWIAFTCLIAFLFWIARGVGPAPQTGPGEKPTSTALKPR